MRAVLLTGIRGLEVREIAEPQVVNPEEVKLRIEAVGVCGSDIHYYRIGRIGSQSVNYPETVGHECAGTVVAVGGSATGVRVGERVAVDPLIVCGCCDQCLAGRPHTCRRQSFLGCPGEAPGALSEYLVMPSRCCYPIPDAMSMVQATMVEPFSIGLYAQRMANVQPGAKIAVLGSGPIGCCVLLACRAAAQCTMYATDLLDERLQIARSCGANWSGNPEKADIVTAITQFEPLGLDHVFECAGEQETLDQALDLLRPGGSLFILGIPEFDRISFNVHLLRRKELKLYNVRRQNGCTADAISLIASGAVNIDPLVTHHFPLTETKKAFEMVANYEGGVMKAMIHVQDM